VAWHSLLALSAFGGGLDRKVIAMQCGGGVHIDVCTIISGHELCLIFSAIKSNLNHLSKDV